MLTTLPSTPLAGALLAVSVLLLSRLDAVSVSVSSACSRPRWLSMAPLVVTVRLPPATVPSRLTRLAASMRALPAAAMVPPVLSSSPPSLMVASPEDVILPPGLRSLAADRSRPPPCSVARTRRCPGWRPRSSGPRRTACRPQVHARRGQRHVLAGQTGAGVLQRAGRQRQAARLAQLAIGVHARHEAAGVVQQARRAGFRSPPASTEPVLASVVPA